MLMLSHQSAVWNALHLVGNVQQRIPFQC